MYLLTGRKVALSATWRWLGARLGGGSISPGVSGISLLVSGLTTGTQASQNRNATGAFFLESSVLPLKDTLPTTPQCPGRPFFHPRTLAFLTGKRQPKPAYDTGGLSTI